MREYGNQAGTMAGGTNSETNEECLTGISIPGKRNILFMMDQLCTAGGAERMLFKMIEGLSARDFSCRLVTFKCDPEVELFRRPPCPLFVFPLRRTYDLNALAVARKIREMIRLCRIDIVHTFHETSDLWGGMVARISGCPVLISSRRDMGIYRSRKHDVAYRILNRGFDAVLAVSEQVRKYCIEVDGFSPDKVVTVHNGVELDRIDKERGAQCRRLLAIPQKAPVIITVGNLRRVKGVDVLLRAAAQICREIPQSVFIVVGRTTENGHFEELIRIKTALGLNGNVKFIGERENVIPLLKASDVFCLPSRSEGFSNALIEAMACGLPCLATRVGGTSEALTDGVNGYLVEPDNPQLLADRLLQLIRLPEKAKELGRAARQTIEQRFTYELMLRKITDVYGRLIGHTRRAERDQISPVCGCTHIGQ